MILSGGMGVTLFFAASAYSLCCAARPGEEKGAELVAYGIRRFFRIAPLFYIILTLSLIRDYWIFGVRHSASLVIANFGFLYNFWPTQEQGIVWASWTIGVEVPFYLMFPYLLARLTTIPAATAALFASLLISIFFRALVPASVTYPVLAALQDNQSIIRHLPVFISGLLAYRLLQHLKLSVDAARFSATALILCAVYLFFSMSVGTLGPAPFHDIYYWEAIECLLVIIGLAIHPIRLIVNRVTVFLGRISYSLYLIHPLVIYFLTPELRAIGRHFMWPTASYGTCLLLTLSVVIPVATISYLLIEKPGMNLGRRVSRAIRGV